MNDAVVICTRNRPRELDRCLVSLRAQEPGPPAPVVVVDGSDDERSAAVCSGYEGLTYLKTGPGLTRQRNRGIDALADEIELVHFIDDDVVLEPGYLAAIRAAFAADPELEGAGGVITNPPPDPPWYWRPFLLHSRRGGIVLSSGRNMLAGGLSERSPVDWLSGCSMSYHRRVFARQRFDEGRAGYSLGEDVDFSFRLSANGRLVVTPDARLWHEQSPAARTALVGRYADEVVHRYGLVRSHPDRLSRIAFWWSITGALAISLGRLTLGRRRSALEEIRGTARGVGRIVSRGDEPR